MVSTTLPATPQATRDYQRSAEPPGLNPDGIASGVPVPRYHPILPVSTGDHQASSCPEIPGQQVSLSVSNDRADPDVSPRNVRSDAVAHSGDPLW